MVVRQRRGAVRPEVNARRQSTSIIAVVPATARYGSWRSPITAELLTRGQISFSYLTATDGTLYWVENRPHEDGRAVLVRRGSDGRVADAIPREFNTRTRVHEYGGGAVAVRGKTAVFSNSKDQRLYRVSGDGAPTAITPEPPTPASHRYADGVITPDGTAFVCVRERHESDGVVNEIVFLPLDGSAPPHTLASGHDFFSTPRLSADGRHLTWLAWDYPNMAFDGTQLYVAELRRDATLSEVRQIAGGRDESIFQPSWSPDGMLYFVSDRTGWWNLYRARDGEVEPLAPMNAEFGLAPWVFGQSTYTFLSDGRIACFYTRDGRHHLALVDASSKQVVDFAPEFTNVSHPASLGKRLAFIGGGDARAQAVIALDPVTGSSEVIRSSVTDEIDPRYISEARSVEFPTEGGRTAHALFYEPRNPEFVGPKEERPPLLVMSHGGPTAMFLASLSLELQFWTSRGFAVVEVNYGGSTGYGREYRERLNGQWGVVDVADCVNAARYLADSGAVDGQRLAIRGGSAGGYTTLCALVFTDVFAAGASYFGVADLGSLARDTHKLEAHYFDKLVGPLPGAEETYRARSPVNFFDRLESPLIIFQGLDDKAVPPAQAEMMVAALKRKGIPFAYLSFEGEGHGFRKAETIKRCFGAELFFYGEVLGFPLGENVEPVEIENRAAAPAMR